MRKNKLKIAGSIFLAIVGVISVCDGILGMKMPDEFFAVMNLMTGISVFICTLGIALGLDYDAGDYECKKCHKRFKPTFKAYFWAMHTPTKRHLKCPHCSEKSFCKRRID